MHITCAPTPFKYDGARALNLFVIILLIAFSLFTLLSSQCSYGLLGASGCGKTTLLSCIVGQKKMQEGHISVLGTNMNSHSAATLGPRIGYMPQDIALVNELSIKETIFYFGRIYGMNEDRIRERFKILKDLLELPDSERLVEKLSGGQKRRVSFACALVHGNYEIRITLEKKYERSCARETSFFVYFVSFTFDFAFFLFSFWIFYCFATNYDRFL